MTLLLTQYYSDSAPSYGMIQKSFTGFRCARTSTKIMTSPGRTIETSTPEIIDKIAKIVLNDLKVNVHEKAR